MGVTVLLALAAALAWGITSYASAPAAREAGVRFALAWSALTAPAVLWPVALLLTGVPDPAGWDVAWAGVFGLGLVGALGLGFLAMTLGRVSIVATVISTDGAMAATVSIARGETVGGLVLAGLTIIVVGVLLAVGGRALAGRAAAGRPGRARGARLGRMLRDDVPERGRGGSLQPVWLVGIGRLVPLALVTLPVLAATRLARPLRRAWPWIAVNAIGDVLGFTAYASAARHDLSVAAVVASEYAVVTVVLGVVLLGERLRPHQWAGVAVALAGIAVVSAAA